MLECRRNTQHLSMMNFKKQRIYRQKAKASAPKHNPQVPPQLLQPQIKLEFLQNFNFLSNLYQDQTLTTRLDLYSVPQLQANVVLKTTIKSRLLFPEHIESSRRELEIHKGLSHPNIVTIYDTAETENEFLILMEYLPGAGYFEEKIETNNIPFNLKHDGAVQKLRSFCFDILSALSYIHARGNIHMDVKPGNLLLNHSVPPNEYPLVKLCDFGLAKQVDDDGRFLLQTRCGTEAYMAPEVTSGNFITSAVDMWSFGVFLHTIAVGYNPSALRWRPGDELRFPARYWRKYEGTGLTDLILSCLRKEPYERITAHEALTHPFLLV